MKIKNINIERTSVQKLLKIAMDYKASDLQITVGVPPVIKVKGELLYIGSQRLGMRDAERLVHELFPNEMAYHDFLSSGDQDFSVSIPGLEDSGSTPSSREGLPQRRSGLFSLSCPIRRNF